MDIKYGLKVEQDDTPVRGNVMASGDAAFDKQVEDEILERLDRGDEWAWALVKVTASVDYGGEKFEASTYVGGCSYRDAEDFKRDGCYADMQQEARENLRQELHRAVARGKVARTLLASEDVSEAPTEPVDAGELAKKLGESPAEGMRAERPFCGATSPGVWNYTCTRKVGHAGDHAAHADDDIVPVLVWGRSTGERTRETRCEKCGHSCPDGVWSPEGECSTCGSDRMVEGDRLCCDCDDGGSR